LPRLADGANGEVANVGAVLQRHDKKVEARCRRSRNEGSDARIYVPQRRAIRLPPLDNAAEEAVFDQAVMIVRNTLAR
jgi:hypothetical protein